MIKKIVIIGPESTGKSTLSEGLANAFQTVWVPEYARAYLENKPEKYQQEDLIHIAEGQLTCEEKAFSKAHRLLFCDTDLYVLKVWSEHAYQNCDWRILQQIANRKYDFYLLTSIDMPWEDDPLREHGDEKMRTYFYKQYLDIVVNSGVPFALIKGSKEERLKQAMNVLMEYFKL